MAGTFDFRYENHNPYIKKYPSASTGARFGTSDIGKLIVSGSTLVGADRVELPLYSTANTMKVVGILRALEDGVTAITEGTTNYIWVQPIRQGDIVQANWSSNNEKSSGLNVIGATNIGYWFGLGSSVVASGPLGKYIDVSQCCTAVCQTTDYNTHFFRLVGYSTQQDLAWFSVNSTHLAD